MKYLKPYLEELFKGAITPYKKSEKLESEIYLNFEVLNADNYKNKVFVKD